MRAYFVTWMVTLFLCGCLAPRERSVALEAQAQSLGTHTAALGEVIVTRAELAIGAIYLCGNRLADAASCALARGEWRSSAVIDLLQRNPQSLGQLTLANRRGDVEVLGAMMDLGIFWPRSLPAPSTDGPLRGVRGLASIVIDGFVRSGNQDMPFHIETTVVPSASGTTALAGLSVRHTIRSSQETLRLVVDVNPWLENMVQAWTRTQIGFVCEGSCEDVLRASIQSAPPVFLWR